MYEILLQWNAYERKISTILLTLQNADAKGVSTSNIFIQPNAPGIVASYVKLPRSGSRRGS